MCIWYEHLIHHKNDTHTCVIIKTGGGGEWGEEGGGGGGGLKLNQIELILSFSLMLLGYMLSFEDIVNQYFST